MLINFSFSINLVASFPDIGSKETRFGSLFGNFGWPKSSTYHNGIGGPFVGLHRALVRDTVYRVIGHPIELQKNKTNACRYAQPRFLAQLLKSRICWTSFYNLSPKHSSFSQDVVFKCLCTYLAMFFLLCPFEGIGEKARYFVICVPRLNGPLWPPNPDLGKLLKTNWLLNSISIKKLKRGPYWSM